MKNRIETLLFIGMIITGLALFGIGVEGNKIKKRLDRLEEVSSWVSTNTYHITGADWDTNINVDIIKIKP